MSKYVLELSEEEARTLLVLTGKVGGCPDNSPRKHTSSVFNRLYDILGIGIVSTHEWWLFSIQSESYSSSFIEFKDYPSTKTPRQLKIEELEESITKAQEQLQQLKEIK